MSDDCVCCCICNHSHLFPYEQPHAVSPAVAGWTVLNDFRARAADFGMDITSPEWAQLKTLVDAYESFYLVKLKLVNGYRSQLYSETLDETAIKTIVDQIHVLLKEIDYQWVETAVACRQLIEDSTWANYVTWVHTKEDALKP